MKRPQGAEDDIHFLGFIPVQVGPASPYARKVRHWMRAILIIQAVTCVCRFVFFKDFSGSFWMVLLCLSGFYAWSQDMNITWISSWGLTCACNGFFDSLALVIPLLLHLITLSWVMIPLRALVPVSEFLGAAFAWHLYRDYYKTGGGAKGAGGVIESYLEELPDPMGKLVDEVDPMDYGSVVAGLKARGVDVEKSRDALQQKAKQAAEAVQKLGHQQQERIKEQVHAVEERLDGQTAPQLPLSNQGESPFSTLPPRPRVRERAPCC